MEMRPYVLGTVMPKVDFGMMTAYQYDPGEEYREMHLGGPYALQGLDFKIKAGALLKNYYHRFVRASLGLSHGNSGLVVGYRNQDLNYAFVRAARTRSIDADVDFLYSGLKKSGVVSYGGMSFEITGQKIEERSRLYPVIDGEVLPTAVAQNDKTEYGLALGTGFTIGRIFANRILFLETTLGWSYQVVGVRSGNMTFGLDLSAGFFIQKI